MKIKKGTLKGKKMFYFIPRDYNITNMQLIIHLPANSALKMHWKSLVRGSRARQMRGVWRWEEKSGLDVKRAVG